MALARIKINKILMKVPFTRDDTMSNFSIPLFLRIKLGKTA